MKITNYVIVFCIILLGSFLNLNNRINDYSLMVQKNIQYNQNIDSAIDSAIEALVEVSDGNEIRINLQQCSNNFYNSLYATFGASDSPSNKIELASHVPLLAVTDEDGMYVQYTEVVDNQLVQLWSNKKPYTLDEVGYSVNFTFGKRVQVILDSSNDVFEGNYDELLENYPITNVEYVPLHQMFGTSIFNDGKTFEANRRTAITNVIVDTMNYYCNRHNKIAQDYGIDYTFALPVSVYDTASRAVDNISLIAIFQGYPYGINSIDTYSRFAVGGARIAKYNGFFVARAADGYLYYHKSACTAMNDTIQNFCDTSQQCAEQGAIPCPYCKP